MEPSTSQQQSVDDPDLNCRLIQGLNRDCLIHILQYLKTPDLHTVGGMNEIFKQIIVDDGIIQKHRVNFRQLLRRGNSIAEFFERYGLNIRRFYYNRGRHNDPRDSFQSLIQLITRHCSIDQLRDVSIIFEENFRRIDLPLHFQRVEKFSFENMLNGTVLLSVPLAESLRCFQLHDVNLNLNFNWTALKNLAELDLDTVRGIDEQNFIEFLHQRPNIMDFRQTATFTNSAQDIFDAIGRNCGKRIQVFRDKSRYLPRPSTFYAFLSLFENVKDVYVSSFNICGADLIDPIKRLAEMNTVEKLGIIVSSANETGCAFQQGPNYGELHMQSFGHLKTITVCTHDVSKSNHIDVCSPMKIFTVYSSQILSNIEKLIILPMNCGAKWNWNFIQFAPKLRQLVFDQYEPTPNQAANILSMLASILENRNHGEANSDVIELKLRDIASLEVFCELNRNENIKLAKINWTRDISENY